jgi:hypothetical protein
MMLAFVRLRDRTPALRTGAVYNSSIYLVHGNMSKVLDWWSSQPTSCSCVRPRSRGSDCGAYKSEECQCRETDVEVKHVWET